jgi:hypothetical protein
MAPEEFYARVEQERVTLRTERYQRMPGRWSDEYRELKGREEAAKYLVDELQRVNHRGPGYLPPREREARHTYLMEAHRRVQMKIERLRQSRSKERETLLIEADALEAYLPNLLLLPWSTEGEVEAYLKRRELGRLREVAESVPEIEYHLTYATMRMKSLREALEELSLLEDRLAGAEEE